MNFFEYVKDKIDKSAVHEAMQPWSYFTGKYFQQTTEYKGVICLGYFGKATDVLEMTDFNLPDLLIRYLEAEYQ